MKDYKAMANSVLQRRDEYVARKKRNKKILTHYVAPLVCLVLVFSLAFFVGYYHAALPSSEPSVTASQPNGDVIWIPELPHLDSENLNGFSNNGTPQLSYFPEFSNYNDFENWLITGKLGNNYSEQDSGKKEFLEKWVYMWQNADYTLKTGYYYKPQITANSPLTFESVSTNMTEKDYHFYYNYNVDHTTPCTFANAYQLTVYSNNSNWVRSEFEKDRNNMSSEESTMVYNTEICNQITYHVFIGNSISKECNFVGIYWEQNEQMYFASYLASKRDIDGYKQILPDLYMLKTPFREDLKTR